QPQVHVWLNDQLLDLRTFEVHGGPTGTSSMTIKYMPGSAVSAWGSRIALPLEVVGRPLSTTASLLRRPGHAPPQMGRSQRSKHGGQISSDIATIPVAGL